MHNIINLSVIERSLFECKRQIFLHSKDQLRVLFQAAYEYHTIYLEVLLVLFAGLRKGEIMGLSFSDFDEEKLQTLIKIM